MSEEKTLSDEEILNRAMISLNGEIYADTEKKSRKMGNAVRKAIKDAIIEARKQAFIELFKKFDEFACIRNDKWYIDFKKEKLEEGIK